MKTYSTLLAALIFAMLGAASCSTLNNAAVEQDEIITQAQKEQPVIQVPGRWLDSNSWEYEAMGDND